MGVTADTTGVARWRRGCEERVAIGRCLRALPGYTGAPTDATLSFNRSQRLAAQESGAKEVDVDGIASAGDEMLLLKQAEKKLWTIVMMSWCVYQWCSNAQAARAERARARPPAFADARCGLRASGAPALTHNARALPPKTHRSLLMFVNYIDR